jgi:hypothetical protein
MKTFIAVVVLMLLVGAYGTGYLPQHRKLSAAQSELQASRAQLFEAQAEIRMYQLQSRLLGLIEKTSEKNFGEAQKLSSDFFDRVRSEIPQTRRASFKSALESALQKRDTVTVALTQGNPTSLDLLREILSGFRQAVDSFGSP